MLNVTIHVSKYWTFSVIIIKSFNLKILNVSVPHCCLFYREKQRLEKELLKSKQTVDQLATTTTVPEGIRGDIDIK